MSSDEEDAVGGQYVVGEDISFELQAGSPGPGVADPTATGVAAAKKKKKKKKKKKSGANTSNLQTDSELAAVEYEALSPEEEEPHGTSVVMKPLKRHQSRLTSIPPAAVARRRSSSSAVAAAAQAAARAQSSRRTSMQGGAPAGQLPPQETGDPYDPYGLGVYAAGRNTAGSRAGGEVSFPLVANENGQISSPAVAGNHAQAGSAGPLSLRDRLEIARTRPELLLDTTNQEERSKVRRFWVGLSDDERLDLVRLDKELLSQKVRSRHRECPCDGCDHRRGAIEQELEALYDAYYAELKLYSEAAIEDPEINPEQAAKAARSTEAVRAALKSSFGAPTSPGAGATDDSNAIQTLYERIMGPMEDNLQQLSRNHLEISYHGRDDLVSDDERLLQGTDGPAGLVGGLVSLAEDLVNNDGRQFIDVMQQLADQRLDREHNATMQDEEAAHGPLHAPHGAGGPHEAAHSHSHATHAHPHPHLPTGDRAAHAPGFQQDEDEYYDDEAAEYQDDEESYTDPSHEDQDADDYVTDDEYYDGEDTESMISNEEHRIEDGRRMLRMLASRMFHQRVISAYRQHQAEEGRQQLLREEADLEQKRLDKEAKKLKEVEKRRDKKRLLKEQKEAERLKREEEERQIAEQKLQKQEQARLAQIARANEKEEARRLQIEARVKQMQENERLEKERLAKEKEISRQDAGAGGSVAPVSSKPSPGALSLPASELKPADRSKNAERQKLSGAKALNAETKHKTDSTTKSKSKPSDSKQVQNKTSVDANSSILEPRANSPMVADVLTETYDTATPQSQSLANNGAPPGLLHRVHDADAFMANEARRMQDDIEAELIGIRQRELEELPVTNVSPTMTGALSPRRHPSMPFPGSTSTLSPFPNGFSNALPTPLAGHASLGPQAAQLSSSQLSSGPLAEPRRTSLVNGWGDWSAPQIGTNALPRSTSQFGPSSQRSQSPSVAPRGFSQSAWNDVGSSVQLPISRPSVGVIGDSLWSQNNLWASNVTLDDIKRAAVGSYQRLKSEGATDDLGFVPSQALYHSTQTALGGTQITQMNLFEAVGLASFGGGVGSDFDCMRDAVGLITHIRYRG